VGAHPCSAEAAARSGVPVAPSLASQIVDPENADLFGTEDFDRVFRPRGNSLELGDDFVQPALADTFAGLAEDGPDAFYTNGIAKRSVCYLRSRGSSLTVEDFAEFASEVVDPISTSFRGMTVLTSPPNTPGCSCCGHCGRSTSLRSPTRSATGSAP